MSGTQRVIMSSEDIDLVIHRIIEEHSTIPIPFGSLDINLYRGGRELPIQPDFVGMTTIIQANERIKALLAGDDGEVVVAS